MQGVKSLTELMPIDGLRFSINMEPLSSFRTSSAWNYGIISDKKSFDICVTKFNSEQEEVSPYNDFLTAEWSGYRGITAIGSFILSRELGLMVKGEGYLKNIESIHNGIYMIELRKLLGLAHIGIFRKENSFGLNYLHRISPSISYGVQLGLTVSLLKQYRRILKKLKEKQDGL